MYGHFNPWQLTDAWWQHLLMLLVSAILGYIIGYYSRRSHVEGLEAQLTDLDASLDDCLSSKKRSIAPTPRPAVATPLVAEPVAPVVEAVAPSVEPTPDVIVMQPVVEETTVIVQPTVTETIIVPVPYKPDDLKVVEGIGPKIEQLCHEAGIKTFADLAKATPERLKEILVAAGSRFQMHDPTTWPDQAALARDGKWDELKKWQDELNRGRE